MAKADYWSENEISLGRLILALAFVAVFFTLFLVVMSSNYDAPVAPEYKIEPVTTITARP